MRIGFDISQTGKLKAGCGFFADSLIRHLAELNREDEFILYPTFGDGYWDPDYPTGLCKLHRPNFRYGTSHEDFEASDSPWVGMTLDLFHAHLEEPDIRKAILKAAPRLLHVHVADTNRQGLGRGHLDVAACLHALYTIRYDGSVVLEVMPPGTNPFQSIKDARSAEVLDGYLRESVAALRHHWENAHRVPDAS